MNKETTSIFDNDHVPSMFKCLDSKRFTIHNASFWYVRLYLRLLSTTHQWFAMHTVSFFYPRSAIWLAAYSDSLLSRLVSIHYGQQLQAILCVCCFRAVRVGGAAQKRHCNANRITWGKWEHDSKNENTRKSIPLNGIYGPFALNINQTFPLLLFPRMRDRNA